MGIVLYICYIDEAGDTGGLPDVQSAIQPVFTLAGLFVDQKSIRALTTDWIKLKRRFYPHLVPPTSHHHEWMRAEVKGSDLRRMARSTSRNDRRFAYGVIQEALKILDAHGAKVVGRVYIKEIGRDFNGTSVYSSTVQQICTDFEHFLQSKGAAGAVIADSRNKAKNSNISHSIFTQTYSSGGSPYPSIIEVPTFGHSDNHAGIQLADVICSALLFPIAAEVCCLPHMKDLTHCHSYHANLRVRYGASLKDMQYRYQTEHNLWWGGISLSDPIYRRKATALFA